MGDQIADGMTSRREWRVIQRSAAGGQWWQCGTHDNAPDAYAHIERLYGMYPAMHDRLEIEEREIITRVVERRVVPRPEATR